MLHLLLVASAVIFPAYDPTRRGHGWLGDLGAFRGVLVGLLLPGVLVVGVRGLTTGVRPVFMSLEKDRMEQLFVR
jgi:hypothetical protein